MDKYPQIIISCRSMKEYLHLIYIFTYIQHIYRKVGYPNFNIDRKKHIQMMKIITAFVKSIRKIGGKDG